MHRLRLLVLLFLSVSATVCHAQGFGRYVGKVQTEWLDNDDRRMRLLTPFSYVDPKGNTWTAPAGWVIDGASIPVFAWSVVGGPFNGKYRDASVIHDVACDQKAQPWEVVHEAFYWAMMASGVEPWRAKVMYAAVYHFGPRWPRLVTVSVPESQVGSASEQALARAEPGSDATVVRVRPQPGPAQGGPRQDKVDVQIAPPPKTLSEQDFENLKERIRQAEAAPAAPKPRTRSFNPQAGGGGASEAAPGAPGAADRSAGLRARGGPGGVSLDDIRNFKPVN
jgi:hypothetical protein